MPSPYMNEMDRYDIDAYHDRAYEEMAMRAAFHSARPVLPRPVAAEEDGADGGAGAYEEEEEEEEEEDEEDDDYEVEPEEEEEEEEQEEPDGTPPHVRVSGVSAAAGAGDSAAAEGANTSTCSVCMDPWTSQGPHRFSCIPCGHVFGRSCLERWLNQHGNQSATCPQCSKRFQQKDIINLYAQEVVVPNSQLEKEISCLREEISFLKNKVVHHDKMFEEMTKGQNDMEQGIIGGVRSKRQKVAEHSYKAANLEPCVPATISFSLQNELPVDGARVISIDASKQIILVSGRESAIDAEYVLTKISMHSNHEVCKIRLPPDTKAVRDMCIRPGGSAIFTSLGKRLSFFSMETDSIVLKWDLPAPGWSCAVDTSGYHIYAGLQNGMVLVFDVRHNATPLHTMAGLSAKPVHTLHSVIDNNGSRKVLSASAVGPCMWDADNNHRPYLLTGTGDQRVCISLACASPSSDPLVASFRPKVDPSGGVASVSQVSLSQTPTRSSQVCLSQTPTQSSQVCLSQTPTRSSQACLSQMPTRSGSGKLGQHTLIRRMGNMSFTEGPTWYASVSQIRMSKSAIIPYGDNKHLFAYGDELLRGVRTWQLPSFRMHADLCTHREPILDLRYAETGSRGGGGYLGCLSEEKLQVFRVD